MKNNYIDYLKKWINEYLSVKYNFIKEVWLYGSYAKKTNNYLSDIDILLVIDDEKFNKNHIIKLKSETLGYEFPDIDLHCIKYYDFYNLKNYDYYIKNIKKEGILLWARITTNLQSTTISE